MKYWIILFVLLPQVWGAEFQERAEIQSRSIASQIIEAIESFQQQMPCGFPGLGIPSLAPYKTPHQDIAIDYENFQAYGEINNFRLDGLDDFNIVKLKFNALLSRCTFEFNWNNVYFSTNYNLTAGRGDKDLRRFGPAKFAVKNFKIWGLLKYNLSLISGKLSVKELSVYASLAEVNSKIEGLSKIQIINEKLNRIIEEWVMTAVNENTNKLAELSNSMAVPVINDILSDMTIGDILAVVGGGGDPNEKEPCIPPQDLDLSL